MQRRVDRPSLSCAGRHLLCVLCTKIVGGQAMNVLVELAEQAEVGRIFLYIRLQGLVVRSCEPGTD